MKNNFLIIGFTIIIITGACKNASKYIKDHTEITQTNQASDESQTNKNTIKIAFGSCNDEDRKQPLWDDLEKENADLFLWLGDNIYGDSEDLEVLERKYALQNSNNAYKKFKAKTPINGTWDDHDYGSNDGGKEFSAKVGSQQLALDFLDIPAEHPRRTQEGIYDKISINKHGISIDIFLLDTRYFRDPIIGKKGKFKGESTGTILGKEQWEWLDLALSASTADYHIFVSSIQLIAEEHGWEKWANFPEQKNKFMDLIYTHNINYPIILSGDRHLAEFASQKWKGYLIYDLTSSSLTHGIKNPRAEANRYRLPGSDLVFKENYGIIEFKVDEEVSIKASIKSDYNHSEVEETLFAKAKK